MSNEPPVKSKTVMITGANGYLASYIVKNLLAQGHTVHACVRDASRVESVKHLQNLPGASEERLKFFSSGDLAHASSETKPYDEAMENCDAVFHAATPIDVKFGAHNGEKEIYEPAMVSTQELIDCIERHANTVQCLVLTSSMSAVAPRPEPLIKDESHWSDPIEQRERQNWYGCAKTSQEQLVRQWFHDAKASGKISQNFVYAAICPTMVIGPLLKEPDNPKENVRGTMGTLQRWLRGGRSSTPFNDSMSFIHVEDCALMHTRILDISQMETSSDNQQHETINQHCRYMSLIESLHWNDILKLMKELHPGLPEFQPYEGKDIGTPTQFNYDNMQSLKVPIRSTRETLADAISYLKNVGALD